MHNQHLYKLIKKHQPSVHSFETRPHIHTDPHLALFVVVLAASGGVKVASARLPSPKTLVGSPTQILAQFPKQQSPKQLQQSSPLAASSITQSHTTTTPPGAKPTIQIKQESGELLAFLFYCSAFYPDFILPSFVS